jgi:hypothetical protein
MKRRFRSLALAGLLMVATGLGCGSEEGEAVSCGPSQPCADPAAQRCVWLPAESKGFCAPACGDGGACPAGMKCASVAAGECWPCRLESMACVPGP